MNQAAGVFPVQRLPHFRSLVLVNVSMAPEIEKEVLPTPELNLNRIGQIIPLVIEMNCAVTVVNFLAPAQINHTKAVWKHIRIFLKPQPESQNIIKALLKSAPGAKGFLVLSEDGVLAFEAGTD